VDFEADNSEPPPSAGSMILKIAIIGFLTLVLLIPLNMISGLVSERQHRQREVMAEIGGGWGREQVIGPIALSVPYQEVMSVDSNGRVTLADRVARFLPEDLQIEARAEPSVRRRSIYDVIIYSAHMTITGHFKRPDVAALRIDPHRVLWEDVRLMLPITDRKGVNPGVRVRWNGETLEPAPSAAVARATVLGTGFDVPAGDLKDAAPDVKLPFEITLDLKGTESLQIQPAGKTTVVHLTSPWRDPSFIGRFLPDTREIGLDGFDATWRLTSLSRSYPQAWRDVDTAEETLNSNQALSAFGVGFIRTVDTYQQTDRSLKYGGLFILLTFTTFILVELLQPVRVHPVQYVMVGAAMCLFYLLLLSLSEHVRFGVAYGAAQVATIGVITMYTMNVLGGMRQGLMTGMGLSVLYAFLYVLLQLEDYALLTGSIALFLVLAFLMFLTRRINWYDLRRSQAV
jgi:inner membrane protein